MFFGSAQPHQVRSSPVSRFRMRVPRLSHVSDCYFQESWICMTPLVGAYCQEIAQLICHKWCGKCSNILIDYHDTLLPLFFVPREDASSSLLWLSNSRKYCLTHLNFDPRPLLTLLLYIPHSKYGIPFLFPHLCIGSRLRYAVIRDSRAAMKRGTTRSVVCNRPCTGM